MLIYYLTVEFDGQTNTETILDEKTLNSRVNELYLHKMDYVARLAGAKKYTPTWGTKFPTYGHRDNAKALGYRDRAKGYYTMQDFAEKNSSPLKISIRSENIDFLD